VSTREMRKMAKTIRIKMMTPKMLRRMMMEPAKVRMMSKVSTREMRKMAKATKLAKKIRRY
jgi:CRISPR/Cas system-associated exonuclease Cas4 (RecB family)